MWPEGCSANLCFRLSLRSQVTPSDRDLTPSKGNSLHLKTTAIVCGFLTVNIVSKPPLPSIFEVYFRLTKGMKNYTMNILRNEIFICM